MNSKVETYLSDLNSVGGKDPSTGETLSYWFSGIQGVLKLANLKSEGLVEERIIFSTMYLVELELVMFSHLKEEYMTEKFKPEAEKFKKMLNKNHSMLADMVRIILDFQSADDYDLPKAFRIAESLSNIVHDTLQELMVRELGPAS